MLKWLLDFGEYTYLALIQLSNLRGSKIDFILINRTGCLSPCGTEVVISGAMPQFPLMFHDLNGDNFTLF